MAIYLNIIMLFLSATNAYNKTVSLNNVHLCSFLLHKRCFNTCAILSNLTALFVIASMRDGNLRKE